MAETAATTAWKLVEHNEWEGETWTIYFDSPEVKLNSALRDLKAILEKDGQENYELSEIEELPDPSSFAEEELTECEYGEEDGCGDCDYCCESEGYYSANGVYDPPSLNKVKAAILYWGTSADERESLKNDEDPLYKLGFLYED